MRRLVCILLVVVLYFTSSALAAVLTQLRIPVNGAVFNPCNGETVTFSGIEQFIASETLDGGGGFHLAMRDNIHVTATGSLGNSYEGNEEDSFELNGRFGVEQTVPQTFSEISTGSAPNFEVHALFHVTVNPNGTVTAFIDNFTSSCRG